MELSRDFCRPDTNSDPIPSSDSLRSLSQVRRTQNVLLTGTIKLAGNLPYFVLLSASQLMIESVSGHVLGMSLWSTYEYIHAHRVHTVSLSRIRCARSFPLIKREKCARYDEAHVEGKGKVKGRPGRRVGFATWAAAAAPGKFAVFPPRKYNM